MTAARQFSGAYSPGGLSGRSRRREIARRAGVASGARRRALSTAGPRERSRDRQQALRLRYRHRQITRAEFERRYFTVRPGGYAAGLETAWQHYVALFKRYRFDGQHFQTTNAQRSAALAGVGRARGRRQVQRLNRLMGAMGLATVLHFHDQGATPGHKDRLIVEIATAPVQKCHPPYGSRSPAPPLAPANRQTAPATSTDLSPPAPPADIEGPAPPAVTEIERLEAHYRFLEAKIELGWPGSKLRCDRMEVGRQLRLVRERGDCASP